MKNNHIKRVTIQLTLYNVNKIRYGGVSDGCGRHHLMDVLRCIGDAVPTGTRGLKRVFLYAEAEGVNGK